MKVWFHRSVTLLAGCCSRVSLALQHCGSEQCRYEFKEVSTKAHKSLNSAHGQVIYSKYFKESCWTCVTISYFKYCVYYFGEKKYKEYNNKLTKGNNSTNDCLIQNCYLVGSAKTCTDKNENCSEIYKNKSDASFHTV